MSAEIDIRRARRLALIRAGVLKPEWTSLPRRATGRHLRARRAAHEVISRFGYLQLDSIPVSGARTHGLVLASRLSGFDARFADSLLQHGEPLFEYWGHEASWLPMDLYPVFGFRRQEFSVHPWWGDLLGKNPKATDEILRRFDRDGPLHSKDFEGARKAGSWWSLQTAKKVVSALWSAGHVCVVERRGFQRIYDLTERVIPSEYRGRDLPVEDALEALLLKALDGHGWATTPTLIATWRLTKRRPQIDAALERLREKGEIVPCALDVEANLSTPRKSIPGWIRPRDLDLAERAAALRPRARQGVLLSPFDPVLWDRARVQLLFGFEQSIEIYKPEPQRKYGYYSLPVLAGDRLIGRVDLKAHRKAGYLEVKSLHYEADDPPPKHREATRIAIERHADSVGLPAPDL